MDRMDLYRNGLLHAAERLIQAEAECRHFADDMMKEKQAKVVKKCLGKIFKCDDIFGEGQWHADKFKGREIRCVGVDYRLHDNMYYTLVDQHYEWQPKMASITLHFLCDPDEYLNSRKKLTDKEKVILRDLKGCYDCRGNSRLYPKAERLGNDLLELKNFIHMYNNLKWSFSLDNLLADDFLTGFLWANNTRIY